MTASLGGQTRRGDKDPSKVIPHNKTDLQVLIL